MNTSLIEYILLTSSALFIAVNPLAVVPAFLAMTHNDSAAVRARIAVRACFTAGAVLALFALAGTWILAMSVQFGINALKQMGVPLTS